jgi:DnaJ-domain-containing protein 1
MENPRSKPRFKRDIRIKPDVMPAEAPVRPCDRAGCPGEGAHRVPKSKDRLEDHLWLCTAHAREHNEHWDFFAGMSEREIERFRIESVTGHRPTWPLGKRAARMRDGHDSPSRIDAFGMFSDVAERPKARPPERKLTRLQIVALETMSLEPSATLQEIKARYKELVKRFHPDANGGDRGAEERLKQVIKAYGVLRASGLT